MGLPPRGPPQPPDGEPDSKRLRTDTFVLQDEEEFLDAHPGQAKVSVRYWAGARHLQYYCPQHLISPLLPPNLPLQVYIQCPAVEGSESMTGQLLAVEVASLGDSVGALKQRLAEVLGVPANKQHLRREVVGFLRDELTLAYYNVLPDVHLQLSLKTRGGRKK